MDERSSQAAAGKILLVDDQPANLDVLCRLLEGKGYEVAVATSAGVGIKIAQRMGPDLILMDVMMPEVDGLEACRRLKEDPQTQSIPVVFITAQDRTEGVVAGFAAGGIDYIAKPFREEEVLARVETQVRLRRQTEELVEMAAALQQKNEALAAEIDQRNKLKGQLSMISESETARWGLEGFVGQSSTIKRIFEEIRLLQESASISVLIAGESGTGKELIARAVHFGGARSEGPFIPVNCAAIPGELVESLLFGHAKGAFTGADSERIGYFEMAHEGTLFLDEIGELPLQLQARFLRVLEDGQVWRLGEKAGRQVDVRVVAATNVNLQHQVQARGFRQDLYFRLARFAVTAPPLRDRRDDIPLLARHFLQLFADEMGCERPELSLPSQEVLLAYDFPGNVRELKNILERALMESRGRQIEPHHLHFFEATDPGAPATAAPGSAMDLPLDLDRATEQAEVWVVKRAMDQSDNNVSEAARLLGVSRNRIYRVLALDKEGDS
ncbi:MAG: response regulator [Candidatus Latescibacteria bacterium]|nr:response regulator [Candidatus Latescibacterota bacterium]